jgi:hypothetical protein
MIGGAGEIFFASASSARQERPLNLTHWQFPFWQTALTW